MSRSVFLLLTLCLLKNEVKCGTLGNSIDEGLLPIEKYETPTNSSQTGVKLNFTKLLTLREALRNITQRINLAGNSTSARKAKFLLPKFELLAGLNLDGGAQSSNLPGLENLAKITEASNSSPGSFNHFVAASYDPFYPSSNNVQQTIVALSRLLDFIMNPFNYNATVPMMDIERQKLIIEDVDDEIDDGKRRKDKFPMKRRRPTKKKQDFELEEDYEEDNFEEVPSRQQQKPQKPTLSRTKPKTTVRQSDEDIPMEMVTPPNSDGDKTNATNNGTQNNNSGYYYGGQPQYIGNVGITYDLPNRGPTVFNSGASISPWGLPSQNYGPPAQNYGPPAQNYGPPTQNYGPPSQTYGTPSQTYGTPSQTYGTPSQTYGTPSLPYNPPGQASDPTSQNFPSSAQIPDQSLQSYGSPTYSNSYSYASYPPYRDSPIFDNSLPNSLSSLGPWSQGKSNDRSGHYFATPQAANYNGNNGFVPF